MKLDFINIKREREKHITRLHIILFFMAIIITVTILIIVKSSGAKKIARYKQLEKDLNTATIYYYGEDAKKLEKGRMEVVSMKTIIDNGYLQDSLTNSCTGYTIVSNYKELDEYVIGYDSYIKCGTDYQTDNYSDDYIN